MQTGRSLVKRLLGVTRSCGKVQAIAPNRTAPFLASFAWRSARSMVLTGPRPLVLCGPSGSGKSTLLKSLMDQYGNCLGFSISHTTRKPRPGEENGKDYHFVDRDQMEAAIANGEFVESAQFSGNLYGTSKKAVEEVMRTGKICILDIDVQGVINIKKTNLNPKFVFIKPPSLAILEERLRARKTETEESLQKRLTTAKAELEYGEVPGNFDLIIVNDNVEEAYQKLKDFVIDDIRAIQEVGKK